MLEHSQKREREKENVQASLILTTCSYESTADLEITEETGSVWPVSYTHLDVYKRQE